MGRRNTPRNTGLYRDVDLPHEGILDQVPLLGIEIIWFNHTPQHVDVPAFDSGSPSSNLRHQAAREMHDDR